MTPPFILCTTGLTGPLAANFACTGGRGGEACARGGATGTAARGGGATRGRGGCGAAGLCDAPARGV
jgi:hypothetical protein